MFNQDTKILTIFSQFFLVSREIIMTQGITLSENIKNIFDCNRYCPIPLMNIDVLNSIRKGVLFGSIAAHEYLVFIAIEDTLYLFDTYCDNLLKVIHKKREFDINISTGALSSAQIV